MSDLKAELATLRIDREAKPRRVGRWLAFLGILLIVGGVAGFYLISGVSLTATEVETTQPTVQSLGQGAAGAPILTASGYVVARRQAVVSAKIQGRLAQLNVEEGSYVHDGDVIAKLESADYEAQVEVAKAGVQQSEANLAEQQRQMRITQSLAKTNVMSQDQLDAAISRVRL